MKMIHLQYSLLFLVFISPELSAAQPYKTSVLPITRDTKTSLYSIPLEYHWGGGISPKYTETYLIDLDGDHLWRHCPSPRHEIGCAAPECSAARSYLSPICPPSNINASDSKCKCITTAVNPVDGECDFASLSSYSVIIPETNGRNPVDIDMNQLFVSCASLPAMGVVGLSQAPLALPTQLNPTKIFALCLPSTEKAKGVVFFGDGPYYLNPFPSKLDLRTVLYYTPLLKHPSSPEYFIGLKGISINGKDCNFRRNAFDLDSSGNGGVKISTVVPFTRLRSDIYKAFVREFSKASVAIPRAKKVGRFDFCIETQKLKKERLGLPVPTIDLELASGEHWPIFGANSMKEVGNNVACLAFVDGGRRAQNAVVIGTYQLENNFLLFDIAASRVGISASLSLYKTTCGNFNFTTAG